MNEYRVQISDFNLLWEKFNKYTDANFLGTPNHLGHRSYY
jgi:hypothetical protein